MRVLEKILWVGIAVANIYYATNGPAIWGGVNVSYLAFGFALFILTLPREEA